MTRREYCEQMLSQLRRLTVDEQQAVQEELDGHMEDHICALMDLGYDESLAEERTLELMGDPAEVGRELNRQYPLGWKILGRIAVAVTAVLCAVSVFSVGMLGFVWDSFTWRVWPPEIGTGLVTECVRDLDIRVPIGNDVLRVYRVSLGWKDGKYLAETAVCAYDRIPGGIVSNRIFGSITPENQRGEALEYGRFGGGSGHWRAMKDTLWTPIQAGDDHIMLRYERFGETVLVEVPLPEGGAP